MTKQATKYSLSASALIAGLLVFAALMTSAGIDLRDSMVLPIAGAGFVVYSVIAYYIDRAKSGR